MEWTACHHCKSGIITTHEMFKPRTKMVARDNDAPEIKYFCSDACFNGYDLSIKDKYNHDIIDMVIVELKRGKAWLCFKCMSFWDVEEMIK